MKHLGASALFVCTTQSGRVGVRTSEGQARQVLLVVGSVSRRTVVQEQPWRRLSAVLTDRIWGEALWVSIEGDEGVMICQPSYWPHGVFWVWDTNTIDPVHTRKIFSVPTAFHNFAFILGLAHPSIQGRAAQGGTWIWVSKNVQRVIRRSFRD